jgi:Raf kinase inhibitor-like YbhB/YbcL family protein
MMVRAPLRPVLFLVAAAALAGCGENDLHPLAPSGVDVASITLTSRAFVSDGTIPIDFTCDGKGTSPQLTWSAPPEGTKALAIVLEDSDAASRTQWIAFDLPPETTSLAEGADIGSLGGKLGANASSNVAYDGPCPPRGELHRYTFRIIASNKVLGIKETSKRQAFDNALNGHLIGEGTLVGRAAR